MGGAALVNPAVDAAPERGRAMLQAVEEQELDRSDGTPLVRWRFFRVRRGANGPMLAAPLIHNPDFELLPSKEIVATCYDQDHPAPAPAVGAAVCGGTGDA
jgi:hypothetical protein